MKIKFNRIGVERMIIPAPIVYRLSKLLNRFDLDFAEGEDKYIKYLIPFKQGSVSPHALKFVQNGGHKIKGILFKLLKDDNKEHNIFLEDTNIICFRPISNEELNKYTYVRLIKDLSDSFQWNSSYNLKKFIKLFGMYIDSTFPFIFLDGNGVLIRMILPDKIRKEINYECKFI